MLSLAYLFLLALVLSMAVGFTSNFRVGPPKMPRSAEQSGPYRSPMRLMMGGNKAAFGLFSPAVVVAKFALGDAKFNKVC